MEAPIMRVKWDNDDSVRLSSERDRKNKSHLISLLTFAQCATYSQWSVHLEICSQNSHQRVRARVALCLERDEVCRTLYRLHFANLKLQHRQQKRPERFFAHRARDRNRPRIYWKSSLRVPIIRTSLPC